MNYKTYPVIAIKKNQKGLLFDKLRVQNKHACGSDTNNVRPCSSKIS